MYRIRQPLGTVIKASLTLDNQLSLEGSLCKAPQLILRASQHLTFQCLRSNGHNLLSAIIYPQIVVAIQSVPTIRRNMDLLILHPVLRQEEHLAHQPHPTPRLRGSRVPSSQSNHGSNQRSHMSDQYPLAQSLRASCHLPLARKIRVSDVERLAAQNHIMMPEA